MKICTVLMLMMTASFVMADSNQDKVAGVSNGQVFIAGVHQPQATVTFAANDFEAGFPGAGWTVVQLNVDETWSEETTNPLTGASSASVLFDANLNNQDEWLVSPVFQAASGLVDVNHLGSIFWCRDNNDNCDLDVMLVVDGIGGGDDVLLKRLDDDWPASFTLTATQIDFTANIPGPASNLQIAFRLTGNDGAQVSVDDIVITGEEPAAILAPPTPVPSLSLYALISLFLVLLVFGYKRSRA